MTVIHIQFSINIEELERHLDLIDVCGFMNSLITDQQFDRQAQVCDYFQTILENMIPNHSQITQQAIALYLLFCADWSGLQEIEDISSQSYNYNGQYGFTFSIECDYNEPVIKRRSRIQFMQTFGFGVIVVNCSHAAVYNVIENIPDQIFELEAAAHQFIYRNDGLSERTAASGGSSRSAEFAYNEDIFEFNQ